MFFQFHLPTLHNNLDLKVESRKTHKKWHLNVLQGRGVQGESHNFVPVSTPDVILMDGVIHLIDSVLLPPALSGEKEMSWLGRLNSLLGHSQQTIENLVDLLEPYIDEP
jgi:hypothetical protein